jgi:hypothetical protein
VQARKKRTQTFTPAPRSLMKQPSLIIHRQSIKQSIDRTKSINQPNQSTNQSSKQIKSSNAPSLTQHITYLRWRTRKVSPVGVIAVRSIAVAIGALCARTTASGME